MQAVSPKQPELTPEEIGARARQIYTETLKPFVETPRTIGQFVTIDVLSGDYEVGPNHIANVAAVRARHGQVKTCTLRIGYTKTYARGGSMVRTA